MVNDIETIEKIIAKNGVQQQSLIAIEELAELQQAISKSVRNKNGDTFVENAKQNLIEEMADVQIVMLQLKIMYQINDTEIDEVMNEKIKRIERRYLNG